MENLVASHSFLVTYVLGTGAERGASAVEPGIIGVGPGVAAV